MARVFAFDENSYRRIKEATNRVLRTPRRGSQQRRQVPVLGGGGGGGTTLEDACECNTGLIVEGVTLDGSPTICCEGHQVLSGNFGTAIGSKKLYYVSGDVWSTFNSDSSLDNPWENDCGSGMVDEYDIVLELTSTGAIITLEARDTLNCDQVCFQYILTVASYGCKKANRFTLDKFTNAAGLLLPACVCIQPFVNTVDCSNCINDVAPEYITIDLGTGSYYCVDSGFVIPDGVHTLEYIGNCQWQAPVGDSFTMRVSLANTTLNVAVVGGWANESETIPAGPHDCLNLGTVTIHDFDGPLCVLPSTVPVTFPGGTQPNSSGHCDACGGSGSI